MVRFLLLVSCCFFCFRCKVNCKHLVITTDILSVSSSCISGVCLNTTSHVFSWELFRRKANVTGKVAWTKVNDLEKMTLSNTTSKNLVFRANVLEQAMSYVVRMRQGSDGYKGLTEYSFTTSTPPHGGNCSVMPPKGKAYQDTFTFRCSNWKTTNLPLLYVFAYQDPYTLLRTTLFRTEEHEFSIKLPPGDPAENFLLTVYFSVIDSLGAEIDNHKLITVFSTFLLVIVLILPNMIYSNSDGLSCSKKVFL